MRRLRTTSTQRLLTIVAALVALALTGAFAQAAISGSDPKPEPKPLDRAVHDAVTAPPVEGVSARDHVHQQPAPLRLAAERRRLPARRRRRGPPVAGRRRPRAARAAVRGRRRPDRGRRRAPDRLRQLDQDRLHDGGAGRQGRAGARGAEPRGRAARPRPPGDRLDAVRRPADLDRRPPDLHRPDRAEGRRRAARRGRAGLGRAQRRPAARRRLRPGPGRAGARARGRRRLLRRDRRLHVRRPAARRARAWSRSTRRPASTTHGRPTRVRGVDAVQQRLPFELSAPEELAGLPRAEVRLVDASGTPGAVERLRRGHGRDRRAPARGRPAGRPAAAGSSCPRSTSTAPPAPSSPRRWARSCASSATASRYTVLGSVPPVAAENAARGL